MTSNYEKCKTEIINLVVSINFLYFDEKKESNRKIN